MANFNMKIWNAVLCFAATAGLVLTVCFNNADTVKWLGMILMLTTLGVVVWRFRDLRQRMNPVLLMLMLITAMGGISTAYALSGKFALQGFLYLMTSLCASVLLTAAFGKNADLRRILALGLADAAAFLGFVSIDHASTRLISPAVLSFLGGFTTAFEAMPIVEEQVRLNSILGMPNVFAGCVSLGALLSLSLSLSAARKGERRYCLVLLYINALSFLLAFSMGATLSMAAAVPVYLLLERKGKRSSLAAVMMLTLVTVLLGLIPVSGVILSGGDGFRIVPMLCVVLGAALLCAADRYLVEKLSAFFRRMGKRGILFGCAIASLVVIAALTACLWTGGSTLVQGEGLRRAIYPEAGSYTVTADVSGSVGVTVESQNRQEAMMHTSTVLYRGDLENAAFTMPEDALVVYFNFTAHSDAVLERVSAGSYDVPLNYRLLPDFIANRLQGIFANQNLIQRTVFFSDGLKLYSQSPLLGQGIGAFESAVSGVQSFFYETKYVHNHYIQTLLETGLVGLGLFVGLLILSALAVLRTKKEGHPFRAALGALVIYMAIHAGTEVIFSSGFYLPLAFGVFSLIGVCCGEALAFPKKLRTASVAALGALMMAFAVLLSCNLYAAQIGHNAKTMEDFQKAERLDPFEWTDYAVSYVAAAPAQGTPAVLQQAEEYVAALDRVQSNNIHYHLARYCFETGQMSRGMEMALKQAKATVSNSRWWNTIFVLLYEYDDGSALFRAGVQDLAALMQRWNSENLGKIVLDEAVQSYVNYVLRR